MPCITFDLNNQCEALAHSATIPVSYENLLAVINKLHTKVLDMQVICPDILHEQYASLNWQSVTTFKAPCPKMHNALHISMHYIHIIQAWQHNWTKVGTQAHSLTSMGNIVLSGQNLFLNLYSTAAVTPNIVGSIAPCAVLNLFSRFFVNLQVSSPYVSTS